MKNNQFSNEQYLERIRQLRLIDDDFLQKCFEGNTECTELVIRIVLGRNDLHVTQVHTQHQVKNLQGRSVIFDVYAVDQDGKKYNIEIQRADRGANAKRARYHSSVIDANSLEKGDRYEDLAETYVIFLTENDVWGRNLPIYHVERTFVETGEGFNDGQHIVYVNGAYRDNSPLGLLIQDFFCTKADDMQYPQLAERVRYFKENEKGVATMCRLLEEMVNEAKAEARAEARAEGRAEAKAEARAKAKATAQALLSMKKLTNEEIAQASDLTIEEVEGLAKAMEN